MANIGIDQIPDGFDEWINVNVEIIIVEKNQERNKQVTGSQRTAWGHTLPKIL